MVLDFAVAVAIVVAAMWWRSREESGGWVATLTCRDPNATMVGREVL